MKGSQNCREHMDCINTHVNGVYREVQGKRQDETLDRTLCSTLKLGNVCLGVSLLLLLFFMDLGSVLDYTLSSLHPGRVKVTPLQWPTRQRQEKPGFSCRFLPTTGQKKHLLLGNYERENNIRCKNCIYLLGTSCAGICHWSQCRGVAFFTSSFF